MIAKLKLTSIPWPTVAIGATVFIMAIGVDLRIWGLASSAIRYDESFSLALVQFDPIRLVQLAATDFNPPLWELTAWLPARIGGLAGMRLAALVFGLLAIYLAWRVTREWMFSTGQTLAALIIIAVLPSLIWTSQDARCYALMSCLYLGAILYAIRGERLGLVACCGLLVYTNNAGPIYASSALVVYAATRAGWQKAQALLFWVAALSLPWAQTFLSNAGAPYWLEPFSLPGLAASLMAALFMGSQIPAWYLWLAALVLAVCILASAVLAYKADRPLAIAGLLPLALMIGFSVFQRNMIFYRPLIPLVIPLALLFARSLTPHRLTRYSWMLPYLWAGLLLVGVAGWNPSARGAGLDQAAARIRAAWQPGDVVYYATGTVALPMSHYLGDLPAYVLDEPQPAALLQRRLGDEFGLQYAELGKLDRRRAWILWPRDPVMPSYAQRRMQQYTMGAELVETLQAPQFADIEIYMEGK